MKTACAGDVSIRVETWPIYIEEMEGSRISSLATALADPTRAAAVAALLSGTAHTSGEPPARPQISAESDK